MQKEFLEQLGDQSQFVRLFERLPGVCFFAKNRDGRVVMGNQLFVEHCGFQTEAELIGKGDHDIFPASLAQCYIDDDRLVMETEQPITNRVELFPNYQGVPEWFRTNKLPLYDREGAVAGVCGTTQSYEKSKSALQPYLDVSKAVDYIRDNLSDVITVPELAKRVHMSVRQFERKFKQTFHTTPQQYVIKMRIHAACERLVESQDSITTIALDTGFYDHSSFTRHFSKHMGTTPLKYRKATKAASRG